jgi:hypothetical protein
MAGQNFAATALYFERRASQCKNGARQRQFADVARYYRDKAAALGCALNEPTRLSAKQSEIPQRRQRLIELFRAYDQSVQHSKN